MKRRGHGKVSRDKLSQTRVCDGYTLATAGVKDQNKT